MAPQTTVPDKALAGLREDLAGEVLVPGDPGYDEARAVFNGMIDRRPAVIAQCETPEDVSNAVVFGRETGLPIAVRGGGHSVAGTALNDGGLVVDLRRMHAVVVDPEAMTVRVEGGATMSHLDHACRPFHVAVTGGRASTTGVGGFTLGGGSGWLERKFGLACDNLLSLDLITAEGKHVHTDAEENPDLFWALHGGGGNFGVVTSMTLRVHPLPEFSFAMLLFPKEAGPDVVRAYRDLLTDAPDEAGGGVIYLNAPPEEFIPVEMQGTLLSGALVTWAGPAAEVRGFAEPLFALKPPVELLMDLPYVDFQCMLDDPPGMRNYWSAEYLSAFPDPAVDVFCARADGMIVPSGMQHVLFPLGGRVARGPADSPIPWRSAPWGVHPFAVWEDPADDERAIQWVRDVRADVLPWSTGAVYLNFTGDEGRQRVVEGFGAENYQRLARVKAAYDPDNVFRFNHNIAPAA
ncbi:FAD-binding oxidoreductase [Streptomyces roseicoloratus]|uniref:FAD-binding oxidoreductase n=1 Tax=Streptomyces roseicoloratus TaxID=2508722 RepID=A0ABY9S138_9ACTN|nr:FAD-binding oxidoreductase [Streptomyces roseicoloratus]WMX47749.1 FAD-binding oxidoreductase [Streptomyces roseicoloratus]